jgi:hypothetical protein
VDYRRFPNRDIAWSECESGKFALIRSANRAKPDGGNQRDKTRRHLSGASFQPRYFCLIVVLTALLIEAPARAQLLLPGALQSSPATGNIGQNPPGASAEKAKPPVLKPPSESTITGHELARDGVAGTIAFGAAPGKGVEIIRLSLAGEAISHPGEPCRVDVVSDTPIQTKYIGRPNGVSHYEVDIAACPFSFDVLDGAVMVTSVPLTCDFTAADCRAAPAGFWGPPGNSFGPDQIKQLERERGLAESVMRAEFRALLANVGKDKAAIKKIAGEQAGFSSERDVTCRTYAGEDVHGFCALRVTQARALALQTAFEANANPRLRPAKTMAKKAAAKQALPPNLKPDPQAPPPIAGPQ